MKSFPLDMRTPPTRRPRWVYDRGDEPDYRFSFANERTFLAWIRTSIAILAAGVALDVVELSIPEHAKKMLGIILVCTSIVIAVVAWFRWAISEIAIRESRPLPAFRFGVALSGVTVTAAIIVLIAVL